MAAWSWAAVLEMERCSGATELGGGWEEAGSFVARAELDAAALLQADDRFGRFAAPLSALCCLGPCSQLPQLTGE